MTTDILSGGWERGKLLGVGAHWMVSEARPLPDNPNSCIFPPLMVVKSSFIYNFFLTESLMLSKFKDHPNIIGYYGNEITTTTTEKDINIPIHNIFLENESITTTTEKDINIPIHNIFLEYASNGCLADEINKTCGEGLSEKKVSEYLKGMLLGLSVIHKASVIHCDIKPVNILIADGVPKIADFGLAFNGTRMISERGTPEYMAPEIARHGIYTPTADIWSLGCTVLNMLTGEDVWGAPFEGKLMSYVITYGAVPKIPNELSAECRDFLERCLVMDYKGRWSSQLLLNHPFLFIRENPTKKVKKLSYLAVLKIGLEE